MGTAAGSALALALLVCGCVFAALAGPALSLHTRTQALHQTVAGFASTTKTVQVTGSWGDFTGSLQSFQPGQNLSNVLPQVISDVGHGLRATPLPLAADAWGSLSTNPIRVSAGAAPSAQAGLPPELLVSLPHPFTGHARLVAGTFSGARRSAGRGGRGRHHADGRAVRDAPGQPPDAGRPVRPGHAVRHRHRAERNFGSDLLAAGHDPGEAGARAGEALRRRPSGSAGSSRTRTSSARSRARSAAPASRCSLSTRSTSAA